jgi:hypothetical protein
MFNINKQTGVNHMNIATENRFNEGDTIHDIDGNTYTVINGRARLDNSAISYDLATIGRSFLYRSEFEQLPYKLRN